MCRLVVELVCWNIWQIRRWLYIVKFFAFGDIHYDEINDGDRRIDELLHYIKESKPDFCVSLGDCCYPQNKNKKVLRKLETAGIPIYYAVGNHETDHCHLEEVLKFYSLDSSFYSFGYEEYKFIVLNSCYWSSQQPRCKQQGINLPALQSSGVLTQNHNNSLEYSYYGRNYKEDGANFPLIPVSEMKWLKKELQDEKKYIIFSHHSLVNDFKNRGIYNRNEVRHLFHNKKVILCMNGHDHGDNLSIIDNIPFYTVNSASYVWLGAQIMNSKRLTQCYGYLNGKLLYKQTLCVLVEIDETEIRIKGMEGEYLSVTPGDIELYDYEWNGVSIKPRTSSHNIKYSTFPTYTNERNHYHKYL